MTDRPTDSPSQVPATNDAVLQGLQNEIRFHQKRDDSRSVLARGIGAVWGLFQKNESSVDSMQALYQDAQTKLKSGDAQTVAQTQKEIVDAIAKDRKDLSSRDSTAHYASGFAKTAFLFVKGPVGTAGTVALYGLDQWNPNGSLKEQMVDVGLGAAKGGGMKLLFNVLGDRPQTAMVKGVTLGIGNSILDVGLSRDTYKTGKDSYSLTGGLGSTFVSALDWKARAIDGAVFVASEGTLRGANGLFGGAINRSPLLSTMFTGGAFGMSSGGVGEYMRQKNEKENFNLGKIIESAAIQGLSDSAAASFGGMQALRAANRLPYHTREYVLSDGKIDPADLKNPQSSATLNVQEKLGVSWNGKLKLGPEQSLFIAHNNADSTTFPVASAVEANIIASCLRETMPKALGGRHVMPEASGDVYMRTSADGTSIQFFDAQSRIAKSAMDDSIVLGGGGGHGGGRGHYDGPTSSGADIDNLLGGRGRGDNDPVKFRREAPAETAPKVRVRINVPDELVPAAQKLVELSRKMTQESAGETDRQALIDHLKAYPQLHESAQALAGAYGNAKLSEAVGEGTKRADGLVEKTYMVGMQAKTTLQIWDDMKANYIPALAHERFAASYQQALVRMIGLYPEVRPAVDHFARTSPDLNIVEGLDAVLGTKYADDLRARQAAAKVAEPADTGKREVGPVPEAGEAGEPGDTSGLKPRVELAPGALTDAAIAEKAKALSTGEVADRARAASELVNHLDKLSNEDFERWLGAAADPNVLAHGLDSANPYRVARTVTFLADSLNQLSDLQFLQWKRAAAKSLLDGWMLSNPALENRLDLVKEFLSNVPSEEARREQQWRLATAAGGRVPAATIAPDWAKSHVEDSQRLQAEQEQRQRDRAREQPENGKKFKVRQPWKPQFRDSLDNRVTLLSNVTEAFDKAPTSITPQAKELLLRLGAGNKKGLLGVLDAIGCRTVDRNGPNGPFTWVDDDPRIDANRRLMVDLVTQAKSMEPLDYMFQFMRERNPQGAYAAAQEMQPQAGPGDSGEAEAKWNEIRKLLSDVANGRIQSPRRGKDGLPEKGFGAPKAEARDTSAPRQPEQIQPPTPPAPPPPDFGAMDETGRKQYLKDRLRKAIPQNAVSVEPGPDGTMLTINGNPTPDEAYKQIVEKPGEYKRYEFKNGDVITVFEGGKYEVKLAGGSGFEFDWQSPKPEPALPPPEPQVVTPPEPQVVTPPEQQVVTPPEQQVVTPPEQQVVTPPEQQVVTPPEQQVVTPPEQRKAGELPAEPAAEPVLSVADAQKKALLDAVPPAKKLSAEDVSTLRDWFERQKAQNNDNKLKKKWDRNETIRDLAGIRNVTFQQVCKLFNWVPDALVR